MAYNQAANNIGGTAIKNINTFGGTASATDAQSIKPAHGTNGSSVVDPLLADMTVLTPAEANQLTLDARAASIIGAADTALEYGYVARAAPNGHVRTLNSGAGTGRVTIAVRLPTSADQNLASGAPYRFVMTFLLATESTDIVTQSLEEQADNTLLNRATSVSASAQVRVLRGSTYQPTGSLSKQLVCGVRTSVTPASSSAFLTAPSFRFLGATLAANGVMTANFDQPMDSSTFINGLAIHGLRSGKRINASSYTSTGNSVIFTPNSTLEKFAAGEDVLLSVTNALRSTQGGQFCDTAPVTKQFRLGSSKKPIGYRRPIKIAMNSVTGGTRYSNLADLNNDGKADLITASLNENKLFTRLGTGVDLTYFGTMQTTNLSASLQPIDLDFGDMNSDGFLDVVVNGTNAMDVLLGNGTGGFSSLLSINHPSGAKVALGDVTGDGKLDLVTLEVANNTTLGYSIVIRENTTTALANTVSFAAATTQTFNIFRGAVSRVLNVSLGNINNDQFADVVVGVISSFPGSAGSFQISQSLINTNGVFGSPPRDISGINLPSPCSFAIGNVTNSSQADIGVNCPSSTGSNFIGSTGVSRPASALFSLSQSQFADLNNDGQKEWISVGSGNEGGTTPPATSSLEIRYSSRAEPMQHIAMILGFLNLNGVNSNSNLFGLGIADLNGDGIPEIVAGDDTSGAQVWRGDTTGSFRNESASVATNPRGSTVADFNRDGIPDIAVANSQFNFFNLFQGNSRGFDATQNINVASSQFAIASGDANNDGSIDAIVGAAGGIKLQLSSSAGGFSAGTTPTESTIVAVQALAVTDLNSDGNLDIISGRFGTGQLLTMLGDGTGTFTTSDTKNVQSVNTIAVSDLNNDGNMDIAVTNTSNDISIFLGAGNGTLGAVSTISNSAATRAVAIADINADGKPDLIYASGNNLEWRAGNGAFGTATVINNAFQAISAPSNVVLGDYNGDGVLDLLSNNGNTAIVYNGLNTGGFAAFFSSSFALGTTPVAAQAADIDGDGLLDAVFTNQASNTLSLLFRF